LKKILFYSAVAVVLGLFVILVPLVTFAETTTENDYAMPQTLNKRLERLEGYVADEPKCSSSDVEALAFSFVVASVVYLLFKRKTFRDDYRGLGLPPY
jgi:hypothetical protein